MTKKSCNFANSIEMKLFSLSRSDTIKPDAIIMPLTMKLLMGSELRNVSPTPSFYPMHWIENLGWEIHLHTLQC